MRAIVPLAAILALAATPVFAQTTTHAKPTHKMHGGNPYARASDGKTVDHGPYTPEANRAYQGGGMVVETPAGGGAPMPAGSMPAK